MAPGRRSSERHLPASRVLRLKPARYFFGFFSASSSRSLAQANSAACVRLAQRFPGPVCSRTQARIWGSGLMLTLRFLPWSGAMTFRPILPFNATVGLKRNGFSCRTEDASMRLWRDPRCPDALPPPRRLHPAAKPAFPPERGPLLHRPGRRPRHSRALRNAHLHPGQWPDRPHGQASPRHPGSLRPAPSRTAKEARRSSRPPDAPHSRGPASRRQPLRP